MSDNLTLNVLYFLNYGNNLNSDNDTIRDDPHDIQFAAEVTSFPNRGRGSKQVQFYFGKCTSTVQKNTNLTAKSDYSRICINGSPPSGNGKVTA